MRAGGREGHARPHACTIRPGLIVGPLDRSGRFTYWPVRVSRGGEVLAPDGPDVPTEIIDVRDLGDFIVHCAERNIDRHLQRDLAARTS